MAYRVKSILDGFLRDRPRLLYEIKCREALDAWKEVVDEYAGLHTLPVAVKDRQLLVHTDNQVLANELSLSEPRLRSRVNARLGAEVIRKIRFRSGRVSRHDSGGTRELPGQQLDLRQVRLIDRAVRTVSDPELREPLRKLFSISAVRNSAARQAGSGREPGPGKRDAPK